MQLPGRSPIILYLADQTDLLRPMIEERRSSLRLKISEPSLLTERPSHLPPASAQAHVPSLDCRPVLALHFALFGRGRTPSTLNRMPYMSETTARVRKYYCVQSLPYPCTLTFRRSVVGAGIQLAVRQRGRVCSRKQAFCWSRFSCTGLGISFCVKRLTFRQQSPSIKSVGATSYIDCLWAKSSIPPDACQTQARD